MNHDVHLKTTLLAFWIWSGPVPGGLARAVLAIEDSHPEWARISEEIQIHRNELIRVWAEEIEVWRRCGTLE